MRWRVYLELLKVAATGWIHNRAPSIGAALAFYSAFTMAPLLIIVISMAGWIFGVDAARGAIDTQLMSVMGPAAAGAVRALVAGAQSKSSGLVATIVGVITLLIGATTVLVEVQYALDRIWNVPLREGVRTLLRSRVVSLGLILGIGFLLLVSVVLTAALTMFTKKWGHALPGFSSALYVLHLILALSMITSLIAMLYKWLPNTPIVWRDVWIGALMTAVLFYAGQLAISFYLSYRAIGSAYGAAGAMVVMLSWLYFSAQIFLFGAEFTHAYSQRSKAIGADCMSTEGVVLAQPPAR